MTSVAAARWGVSLSPSCDPSIYPLLWVSDPQYSNLTLDLESDADRSAEVKAEHRGDTEVWGGGGDGHPVFYVLGHRVTLRFEKLVLGGNKQITDLDFHVTREA